MSQPIHEFRTVMRGYEPSEVDRALQLLRASAEQSKAAAEQAASESQEVRRQLSAAREQSKAEAAQVSADNESLRRQLSALSEQNRADQARLQQLEEELDQVQSPSASAITERAAKILKLAEDEAQDIRTNADAAAETTMANADQYAAHVKTAVDAAAADTADPDSAGLPNFLEYAFGLNPTSSAQGWRLSPLLTQTNSADWLACSFFRNTNAADLTFSLQAAGTLPSSSWSNLVTWTSAAGWSAPALVSEAGAGPGRVRVTVRDAQPISANATRYYRLLGAMRGTRVAAVQ